MKANGETTFKTDVVVTDNGFLAADIEALRSEFVKQLKAAGWQVEKQWVSRIKPYKLSPGHELH